MVIKQLSYKFYEKDEFTPLVITGYSASFNEKTKETDAGTVYTSELNAYVPNINAENDAIIAAILAQHPMFLAVDSANISHQVGDDDYKPSIEVEKINEGKPGAKHGYSLKISLQSPQPAKMQVL